MIILSPFYVRFEQCLLKLQSEALTSKLTPLRPIASILTRQRYITHFHFDNKLLIKKIIN